MNYDKVFEDKTHPLKFQSLGPEESNIPLSVLKEYI